MRLLALLLAVLAVGCAHRATGPLEILPESAQAMARELGRTSYGAAAKQNPDSQAMATLVLSSQPEALRSKVQHSPALDGVAELIAHVLQDEERDLADPVVEQLVWHAGVAADFTGYARA